MDIRIISSKDEIDSIDTGEEMVHLTFRPSNKDILKLVSKCPEIKAVQIPDSYKRTVSNSTKMFLSMKNITLVGGDIGRHVTKIVVEWS